ncbi:MAG: CpsD/CapB family tyrosine-protein kinase [Desulfobacter sp.]|nr:MAG: CpsD/CapB family tyrosine-protein kinase [Desulfobacter sp.]
MVSVLTPHAIASEQFRLLKNNILFPEKGDPPRTIMVTSASPNEGKSFVSANLAVTMARSIDEYVLLMDCDLRTPTIHTLFGYKREPMKGLSEYLTNQISLSEAMKKTAVEKLTILPAGSIPPNPSELLSSEQMRRMLHEVKLRYNDRYVIIDTPPPYITSETNAIARYVDGIILIVRHGKTRIKEVQDIIDIYGKERILGVIKNFSEKSAFGYGYGYNKSGYGTNKE